MVPPSDGPVLPRSTPGKLEWKKGDPVPLGYMAATASRTGFVVAGGIALGVAWATSVGFGGTFLSVCSHARDSTRLCVASGTLFIPGLGPFVSMAVLEPDARAYVPLAIDGAVQTAGAVMLIYGLASRRDVLVRTNEVAGTTVRWAPTPMPMGQSGHGFGIRGTW
jgi:hypothetical protein